jgi:hypothetical protein
MVSFHIGIYKFIKCIKILWPSENSVTSVLKFKLQSKLFSSVRSEVFMAVTIQVEVFWVVMPYSVPV